MDQTNELLKPSNIYNNPGNIEYWQGYAGEICTYDEGRFSKFDYPAMVM